MERNLYHPEINKNSHFLNPKDAGLDFETVYDRRLYPCTNVNNPCPSNQSHPKTYVQNHN